MKSSCFKNVSYNRLNHHYKVIIDLCELIFYSSMLSDERGNHPFSGFMIDMNRMFQNFILKVLQKEMPEESIRAARKHNWAISLNEDFYLPVIEPDILIDEKFLIDTKYYSSPVNENDKLHSNNLYQILTYIKSYNVNGMLLYPENGQAFENTYQVGDHSFTIKTINLFGSVEDFLKAISDLVCSINKYKSFSPMEVLQN